MFSYSLNLINNETIFGLQTGFAVEIPVFIRLFLPYFEGIHLRL
jgi:hypothetical protein